MPMGHSQDDAQQGLIAGIDAEVLARFMQAEAQDFARKRPKSKALQQSLQKDYLSGVPMHWMTDWSMPFAPVIAAAHDAVIEDVDGLRLADFCLGDTGSMFGHSPPAIAAALIAQAKSGLTYMLPSAEAAEAGRLLSHHFGQMQWQIATTATDANRFAIRVARALTHRPKILVFNGCYHGTVDDVMVELRGGKTQARPGQMGQIRDLLDGAICVEFNDLAAVEAALATGEVAAVLTEPVMTNSCMVLPEPGFHAGLRALTRAYDTILMIDEIHTVSSGLGGYSRVHGLEPDMLIMGKCVAGGVATAVWGMTDDLAKRFQLADAVRAPGHSGMGTTLSANPLQIACLVASLSQVMTREAYAHMEAGALRLEAGLKAAITARNLPWHVVRVGARVEFICAPGPLKNGAEAALAHQPQLEAALHLGLLNRGSLIAPFHNMMLISPVTQDDQIDALIVNFAQVLDLLLSE